MTNPTENICTDAQKTEKPQIVEEEDRPFPVKKEETVVTYPSAQDVPDLIKLNDQKHSHEVDNFKNTTGKHILYSCLVAMALAAIADAVFEIDSTIFDSAFEVAKVVATTILGYLFGSKSK